MSFYTYSYKSPIGTLSMLSDGQSISHLRLSFLNFMEEKDDDDELGIFTDAKRWLDIYFSGKQPEFTPQLNLFGTDFQKKVWTELLSIPFGQTTTYGEIAKRVGCRCAQAVGQVIGQNPILLIVPCHRIVGSNGKLGGFSVGIERKIWLLKHEKAL